MSNDKYTYLNGNYIVKSYAWGTKIYESLRIGEDLISEFPDSIDLKITNVCDIGCPFCHESSGPTGKSFDLGKTIKLLDGLPKVGIEIAIGGGDVLNPGVVEDTIELIKWLERNKFLPRITINMKTIDKIRKEQGGGFFSLLGNHTVRTYLNIPLGVSISEFNEERLKDFENNCEELISNIVVYHVITGIIPPNDLEELILSKRRVLILGYKTWGRGENNPPPLEKIEDTGEVVRRLIKKARGSVAVEDLDYMLGFDNLALEQLRIQEVLTKKEWDMYYMGDEFTHSMYVDAVNEEFAPTSRDPERKSWNDYQGGIVEYFKTEKRK